VVTKQRREGGESAAVFVCRGTVVTACSRICVPINLMNVRVDRRDFFSVRGYQGQ
jgi:hypothetical protein